METVMVNTYHTKAVLNRLTTNLPTVSPDLTVKAVIDQFFAHIRDFASINYLYILDEERRLVGVISLRELFTTEKTKKIGEVMTQTVVSIHPHAKQETAVLLALKHNIKAIPAVDGYGTFLGVLTSDTLLDILNQEAAEDILHLSGTYARGRDITRISALHAVLLRLPWVVVGIAGGIISGWVIVAFNEIVAIFFLLSAYVPLMMATGGNIGGQSAIIFIRNATVNPKLSIVPYVFRELTVGVLMGIVSGVCIFTISFLWQRSLVLSIVVAIALFFNSVFAVAVGVAIPWLLIRLRFDPAIGTGPFVTSIKDITSLIVYFGTAAGILALLGTP